MLLPMQTAPKYSLSADSLVISIHDVSTVTRGVVEQMLEDLAKVGIPVTSLLVIPDHHQRGRINKDAEFSSWLRAVVNKGHEAVLHGFYHLRPLKTHEGFSTRLITRFYTAGEGEFYDLSFSEAVDLLREGRDALFECGVKTDGFIAPAWLLGEEAERAVRAEGFSYTTRIGTVIDCISDREYAARSMVYSVRAGWRRWMSLVWNEFLFRLLKKAPLLRIGLHPPDWEHEGIRRHILKCLRLAAAGRKVMTYREWIAKQRDVSLDRSRSSSH
jgi:predicted deacetylase